ncbi:sulfatase [Pelagimonas varians]|uniref:Arylsulfatase n=1 Tax=Pelagimonas varians TaxID=696760 RepID=A0A238KST0_9RHOB|nr:sulfatase [Pelagimonas varians]PYG32516.1 arylsulfatase A-like enzyme [Pelagimonas varians]SMX45768.1 Arylsulfatase [Pelagimonas varians]
MRVILVVFDSLNRRALECYGGTEVSTPNFNRLADKTVTFDNHYVGSLPCMPARRDLHTGRLSFLHRSWGPLEPFDNSVFETLRNQRVYSHLITDHYHYFEDGAGNYHTRYDSYGFFRGQEGDKWVPTLDPPIEKWKAQYHEKQQNFEPGSLQLQNMANREKILSESDFSSTQCFSEAIDFVDAHATSDNWILQLETFDPHEPFVAPAGYRSEYQLDEEPVFDWPHYDRYVDGLPENRLLRDNYKALLRHCDTQLGRLLDKMDLLKMWDDTMMIVTTDHGFLLGEHEWWAKNRMPCYDEVARIPLFVHHPAHAGQAGTRRAALTQTIDIMPTLLDGFDQPCDLGSTAQSLLPSLADPKAKLRETIIYGYFGGAVNLTDGRHTYMRYPENMGATNLNEYTLMPAHMLVPFSQNELQAASFCDDLAFSDGYPVLKIPVQESSGWFNSHGPGAMEDCESVIFDLADDPEQKNPVRDAVLEASLAGAMHDQMILNKAPDEAFVRLGFSNAPTGDAPVQDTHQRPTELNG